MLTIDDLENIVAISPATIHGDFGKFDVKVKYPELGTARIHTLFVAEVLGLMLTKIAEQDDRIRQLEGRKTKKLGD